MKTTDRDFQIPGPADYCDPAQSPRSCPTCGAWRSVRLEAVQVCAGCDQREAECTCRPLAEAA